MTAIFFKLVSAVMSVVVFLSGTFPGLFGEKEYIYPGGEGVTIINEKISDDFIHDSVIIKDYESYTALGDIGVDYDAEYFEENALAIVTLEYQNGDEVFIKSIYKDGAVYEIEYYYFSPIKAQLFTYYEHMTFIIETTKDTRLVHLENLSNPDFIRTY